MADDNQDVVDIFIEIPKGSRNKYEFDHETGRFTLDRMLFSSVHYPGDYGFIPETWAEDDDPLDALVILGDPTFPGCTISARVVGVFYMTDDKGRDSKIISVPDKDPTWSNIKRLEDVPNHLLDEISHFFSIYKDLEGKKTEIHGWGSVEEAREELATAQKGFEDLPHDHRPIMPRGFGDPASY